MRLLSLPLALALAAGLALSPASPLALAADNTAASREPPPAARAPARPTSPPITFNGPIESPETTQKALPQNDAMDRAAQAQGYLSYYLMTRSAAARVLNGPEGQQLIQDGFKNCLQEGNNECTQMQKDALMAALVQTNLVREARSNMLKGNTNFENMRTIEYNIKGASSPRLLDNPRDPRRSTGSVLRQTFMLDPAKVAGAVLAQQRDPATEEQRQILGPEFLRTYRAFVKDYSQSSARNVEWHYVAAQSRAVAGDGRQVIQAGGASRQPEVDKVRLEYDRKTQNSPRMQAIVKETVDQLDRNIASFPTGGPRLTEQTKKDLLFDQLALGLPKKAKLPNGKQASQAQIAMQTVREINQQYNNAEQKLRNDRLAQARAQGRVLSSPQDDPLKNTSRSVQVPEQTFRNFLDAIWPIPGRERDPLAQPMLK